MSKTFRGGIHPPQRKNLAENLSIDNLSVPQNSHIPMHRLIGVTDLSIFITDSTIFKG